MSFTLPSLHFTFINVHVCYLYTPTFSSKSLICLLWISVLSSRSRILCKNKKKMKSVFFPVQRGRMNCRMHFAGITWWAWCSSSILSWRIWQSYSRLFLSICLLSFSTAVRSSSFCSSSRGSPYFITWRKVFPVEWYCFYTHFTDGLIKSPMTILNRTNWNKLRLQSPYPAAAHCIKLLPIPGFAVNGKREGCNYCIIAL